MKRRRLYPHARTVRPDRMERNRRWVQSGMFVQTARPLTQSDFADAARQRARNAAHKDAMEFGRHWDEAKYWASVAA